MTQETLSTSSVGAMWPPAESPYERIRGIYHTALVNMEDTVEFIQHFNRYKEITELSETSSRLSVRAIADLGSIALIDEAKLDIEAAIPLNASSRYLVYCGWNEPNRTPSDKTIKAHISNIQDATNSDVNQSKGRQVASSSLFSPRLITSDTPDNARLRLVSSFTDLYGVFGYSQKDVESILMNPSNVIAYIIDKEGVVSTAMAEIAELEIDGHGTVQMAEITEATTREDMRGKGFYTAISGHLLSLLKSQPEQLDIIYGESNLAMPGVLRAAHENGRRFNHFDNRVLGISNTGFGILKQNFSVKDGAETRPYNDFAVSYLPLK